ARRFGSSHAAEDLRKSAFQRVSERVFASVQAFLDRLDVRYAALLERVMRNKGKLFAGVGAAFVGSLFLAANLGADFFPPIDEGELTIAFRAPIGTRVEETEKIAEKLEEIVREVIPERDRRTILSSIGAPKRGLRAMLASNSGPHGGTIRVELAPTTVRKVGVEDYIAKLRARASEEITGVAMMFSPRGTV